LQNPDTFPFKKLKDHANDLKEKNDHLEEKNLIKEEEFKILKNELTNLIEKMNFVM
jgi:hypothetical protein